MHNPAGAATPSKVATAATRTNFHLCSCDAAWLALRGASAGGFVFSTWVRACCPRCLLVALTRQSCATWSLLPLLNRSVLVNTMANRTHRKSRSPVNAARRDTGRLSQTSTVAAPSQLDALMLAPAPTRAVWGILTSPRDPSLAVSVCSPGWTHVPWGTARAGSRAGFRALCDSSLREH